MNLLLQNLKSRLPSWFNQIVPTEADFYKICRREHIKVVEMPLRIPGFYMVCKGKPFIVINSRLRGVRWLHTAFHELFHHFLHAPPEATAALFYEKDLDCKGEFEARALAVCAMIPEPLLRQMLAEGIDIDGYTKEMLELRLKVLQRYGI